jgi:uncharacterized membrane protein YphA (DoxX/SURF4 family)
MPRTATSKFTRTVGVLFLRVLLGCIFFFQGYAKIFWFGMGNLYASAFAGLESKLPTWLLWGTAYATSLIEVVCGFMVIVGFWRNRALFALAGVVIIATIGHGIESGIFDLQHIFPRAILIAFLLILPDEWDEWDAKHFWKRFTRKKVV